MPEMALVARGNVEQWVRAAVLETPDCLLSKINLTFLRSFFVTGLMVVFVMTPHFTSDRVTPEVLAHLFEGVKCLQIFFADKVSYE